MPKTAGKKKKPKVVEIDGVLWLLDDHGNRVKKVKKKVKGGENHASGHALNGTSTHSKKKRQNVKEIDGVLYQVDENGNPIKKVRRKGTPRESSSNREQTSARRRASSQGPVAGRRRPRERIDAGEQRLRSNSTGRTKQKPGEYVDAKGRKVVIDEDGNKTVYDKNGRRLRPKRKPIPTEPTHDTLPAKLSLSSSTSKPSSFYDRRQDLLKSSIYESGRFDALWGEKPASIKAMPMPTLQESSGDMSFSATDLLTKKSSTSLLNGNSDTLRGSSDLSLIRENGIHDSSNTEIAELSKQVTEYGEENRDLKSQLMAAEEKVRTLTQQNQKEKSKNVKATTEMLQLKADYQQASDEKHKIELELKNLEARYRAKEEELEKLESTPANRRITMSGNQSMGGDHLVTQITDLMAENDALLDKLELAKAASIHDIKKKEEQILFLNEELIKVREENDMLFRGEAEKDPLMGKLLKQKKEMEDRLKQEKEKACIRIDSMQEQIDCLEQANGTLKKELERATLEINDDDDDEVRRAKEMAQAVAKRGTAGNARQVKRSTSIASNIERRSTRRGSGFWGFREGLQ